MISDDIQDKLQKRSDIFTTAFISNNEENAFKLTLKYINEYDIKNMYRYRPFCKREIDTLISNKIYMASPSQYKDSNDNSFIFDWESITRAYITRFHPNLLHNYLQFGEKEFVRRIEKNPKFNKVKHNFRNGVNVACFTESYNNAYMWNEYTNNCGMCLEYPLLSQTVLDTMLHNSMRIFPVRYIRNRQANKDIVLDDSYFNDDEFAYKVTQKCLFTKDYIFKNELEWRLFCLPESESEVGKGRLIQFALPHKIYLFGKIDNIGDLQRLYDFAKSESIEIAIL